MKATLQNIGLFLISGTLLILFWQFWVVWFEVPSYFLPSPEATGEALLYGLSGPYYPHIWATLSATLYGYVLGCGLAIVTGVIVAETPLVEKILTPYIVALQAIPKVALAPLIIVWFGYGLSSKVIMVAMICFFPVFVNVVVGIKATDANLISLFRAFSASRWMMLWHLKLPGAASMIFAGLQVSIVFALIGTIVTEFVASKLGLGVLISSSMTNLNVANMFAIIVLLAVLGIALNEIMRVVHRRVVFWESNRN
ncbi:ABC transporter permease subunit [Pseudooceanicola sp. 216_PA32_1]|uniref:ABC transporter permease subunit n=1 Tax=Pseudooceanicola pacificus TaxID=2676438 RepID=A0A844W6G0_9RHOB|nr:ABC transporter permease [Pseudooceanicola pacificus]MWB78401.1 ABC transporter permease subunit [Pseudooceanicola pacificus]